MDTKNRILVVLPVQDSHKEKLESSAPSGCFSYIPADQVTKEQVQEANIIIGNVPPALLQGSTNLKWMQLNSAGTDPYIQPGVFPSQAILTNATGAYGLAISEHMLAQLLMLIKKLNLYYEDQKNHLWGDRGNVTSIWNSNTLVVGLGNLGSEFARKMHALGSHVTGVKRTPGEKPDYLEGLYQMKDLTEKPELLGNADIVALTLPSTKETIHLFDREMLARMKPGAILLNAGRGNAVDTEALMEALNSGALGGAALDVTDPEPLPADHPLWDTDNLLITPHISGMYHLPETFERILSIAADNLRRFEAGQQLCNEVNFETGYRK
ncbi:MAG: D-2-hydroxyacid dehydrogenase [Lachnospiraceae bacterium]|nr:D-2-hydroxyacid dehydrogenase [Lachnospiraceae bacterium]